MRDEENLAEYCPAGKVIEFSRPEVERMFKEEMSGGHIHLLNMIPSANNHLLERGILPIISNKVIICHFQLKISYNLTLDCQLFQTKS